ncbi:MAG: SDR family NAD(P)-dependent oxidoreductase [Gammaproteobacteria bacterium]
MLRIIGALYFYLRFLPSFTRPAMWVRERGWTTPLPPLDGQTWLVTGASDGIGKAISSLALGLGANVIGVARNKKALDEFAHSHHYTSRYQGLTHDLSSMKEIRHLISQLEQSGEKIDVLVNNVGVMLHDASITDEGFEKSFATNLLGHYALTEWLCEAERLKPGARIINMSSGGMYNVPLLIDRLNENNPYNGTLAYALHKRAQVVLNDHWREEHPEHTYYVMHPGWVNTVGVATSLPRFHKLLGKILRSPRDGADTAIWLGATGPEQNETGIWFDRKLRSAHIYGMTRKLSASGAHLSSYLNSKLESGNPEHFDDAASPENSVRKAS